MFWVQQRVRNNDLDLHYVPGDHNPADIFTKPNIPKERMESLLNSMGCVFQSGRPEAAPTLRKEGGTNVFALQRAVIGPRPGNLLASRMPRLWSDEDEELDGACDTAASYVVIRGMPHQHPTSEILSMQCDKVEMSIEDLEELRGHSNLHETTSLPHNRDLPQ